MSLFELLNKNSDAIEEKIEKDLANLTSSVYGAIVSELKDVSTKYPQRNRTIDFQTIIYANLFKERNVGTAHSTIDRCKKMLEDEGLGVELIDGYRTADISWEKKTEQQKVSLVPIGTKREKRSVFLSAVLSLQSINGTLKSSLDVVGLYPTMEEAKRALLDRTSIIVMTMSISTNIRDDPDDYIVEVRGINSHTKYIITKGEIEI